MAQETAEDRERARLRAVEPLLDTPPEAAFDDVAQLAALVCDTPVALVSLVERDRQWFKARVGFDRTQTDLGQSVCRFVVAERAMVVIPDLALDPRTHENPLVTTDPGIRFYAGAPLQTADGHVLGSLCVIDREPRPAGLTPRQAEALQALARRTVEAVEMRRVMTERVDAQVRQEAILRLGDALRDQSSIAEMTRTAARIAGEVLKASRAGYGVVAADVETVEIEPDWTAPGIASIAGRYRFDAFGRINEELRRGEALVIDDVLTDPRTGADPKAMQALAIGALVNMPVFERERLVGVFIVHDRAPRPWSASELGFIRNVADRLEGAVARVRAEEQQRIVNGEISHRLKNTLSMVQAIASQTLKGVADREAVRAFDRRILALGKAHDVLLQSTWHSADLADVVREVLETAGGGERIAAEGPPVAMGARATLATSLLLHELATNAVKYGALSVPEGRVRVAWRLEGEEGDRELVLSWCEEGGPTVHPPSRTGFGSRLIRGGLVGTGGADVHYAASGVRATFRAAQEQVRST